MQRPALPLLTTSFQFSRLLGVPLGQAEDPEPQGYQHDAHPQEDQYRHACAHSSHLETILTGIDLLSLLKVAPPVGKRSRTPM